MAAAARTSRRVLLDVRNSLQYVDLIRKKSHSILQQCGQRIHNPQWKERYRVHPRAFVRDRKLSFARMIALFVRRHCRSIQADLESMWQSWSKTLGSSPLVSKQAFCQRRMQIQAEVFEALNQELVQDFYSDEELELWHGYRLCAVDGSLLQLSCSEESQAYYGGSPNGTYPMGKVSIVYDVLNGLTLDALLVPYAEQDERALAKQHLERLAHEARTIHPSVWLLDRGYPSFA